MKKEEKEMSKKRKIADFVYFLCASVFLGSFYALQIVLFVVQPGSIVHWRAVEGLPPATGLRRCPLAWSVEGRTDGRTDRTSHRVSRMYI